jgi:hypothetical protein
MEWLCHHPTEGAFNGHGRLHVVRNPAGRDVSHGENKVTPWGWSANQFWILSLALCALVAAADAILGHHVILMGLLIVGPCCAVFTGRWSRVAFAGAWAVGLAVLLGVPDGIWGTATQVAFLGAVVVVAVVSTVGTVVVERITRER